MLGRGPLQDVQDGVRRGGVSPSPAAA